MATGRTDDDNDSNTLVLLDPEAPTSNADAANDSVNDIDLLLTNNGQDERVIIVLFIQ